MNSMFRFKVKLNPNPLQQMVKVFMLLFIMFAFVGMQQVIAQPAKKIVVRGVVSNETGETLVGVNVVIKGTTIGTVTNIDGEYSITANESDVLLFRFIGFTQQEIPINNRININVTLKPETTDLDEVVVVGYGEVKRANLLGSVSSMSSKEIEDIPVTNLTDLLEGRMAGVSVAPYQPTGNPGASTRVQIRTTTTFGSRSDGTRKEASPLYIIDGFIVTQEEWDVMDQSEIESFSVLKDASAAVYGSAGANGVILVKTKRGKKGKISVNYSGSYSFKDATMHTEMLSAYDHGRLINARYFTDPEFDSKYRFTDEELERAKDLNYDWLQQAWKPSYATRNNISVSGGDDRITYFASGAYQYTEGNFPNMGIGKHSYRLGMDVMITQNLKASVNFAIDNRDFTRPFMTTKGFDTMEGLFETLLLAPKWVPTHINDLPVANNGANPFEMFNTESYKREVDKGNTLNVKLTYEFQKKLKGLTATATFSRREGHGYTKKYQIPYTTYLFRKETDRYLLSDEIEKIVVNENNDGLAESFSYGQRYQLNLSLNYMKEIGLHNISGFLTYEQKESSGYGFDAEAQNMQIPNLQTFEAFNNEAAKVEGSMSESGDLGSVGRFNYSYADKYLLESTLRWETSTLFAPGYRNGLFPSVSLGWVLSEESFMRDNLAFINYMKVRGSFGITGYKSIVPYEYKLSFTPSDSYLFGSGPIGGMSVKGSDVVSTGVTWEKSRMQNYGLDLKFLDSRLSVAIDGYYTYQYDILSSRTVELPEASGIDRMPSENYGIVKAWGYDMEIGYHGKPSKDFSWDINAIFNWATNRLIEGPTKWREDDHRYEIGQSTSAAGREEGYTTKGIVRTQEQLAEINKEWNEKWGHNYILFDNEMVNIPDEFLGFLYYQDIARPGDVLNGEPPIVFEPDGRVTEKVDFGYVERTNDVLVWKNFLPVSSTMSLQYKEFTFRMLWTMSYGIRNYVVDKQARKVPKEDENSPAFWSDFWSVDNPDAAYPNPYYATANEWVSSFWMKDVKSLRLRSINISYNMPKRLSMKVGIPSLRFFFTGENLWTPIQTFDYKEDAIARFNTYPLMRSFTFGVNVKL